MQTRDSNSDRLGRPHTRSSRQHRAAASTRRLQALPPRVFLLAAAAGRCCTGAQVCMCVDRNVEVCCSVHAVFKFRVPPDCDQMLTPKCAPRPPQFEPATICQTFRSLRSLDISNLEDVNDHKLAVFGQACSHQLHAPSHKQLSSVVPSHEQQQDPQQGPYHRPASSQVSPRSAPRRCASVPGPPPQIPVSVFAAVSPPQTSPPKPSRRRRSYRYIDPDASPEQPKSPDTPSSARRSSASGRSPPSRSRGHLPQQPSPCADRSRTAVGRARRMLRLTSQSSICSSSTTYQDDSSAAEDSSGRASRKAGRSLISRKHRPSRGHTPAQRSQPPPRDPTESAEQGLRLRFLSLKNCWRVTNLGLQAIAAIRSLEALDLSFCPHIDQQGLRILASLPRLKQLHLGGIKLCKAELQALSHLKGESPAHTSRACNLSFLAPSRPRWLPLVL